MLVLAINNLYSRRDVSKIDCHSPHTVVKLMDTKVAIEVEMQRLTLDPILICNQHQS